MALTPQQATSKWASRLKGAQTEIRQGVEGTTINPMERAAAQQEKYLQRVQEAVSSGKYADRLRSVSLEDWKRNTIEVGIPRIAAGVDKATADMTDFFGQLFAVQDRISAEIEAMPDTTLEDSIARMTHQVRRMSEFHRQ